MKEKIRRLLRLATMPSKKERTVYAAVFLLFSEAGAVLLGESPFPIFMVIPLVSFVASILYVFSECDLSIYKIVPFLFYYVSFLLGGCIYDLRKQSIISMNSNARWFILWLSSLLWLAFDICTPNNHNRSKD